MQLGDIKSKLNKRKGLKNFSWLISDNVIAILISLVTATIINRYLGVERYGILNYCIAMVGLWECIISLGSRAVIQKEVVLGRYTVGELRGTSAIINLIGAIIAFIGVLSVALYLREDKEVLICTLIIAAAFFCKISYSIQNIFIAKQETGLYVRWNVWVRLAVAAFKIVLVFINGNLVLFSVSVFLESWLQSMALIYLAKKHLGESKVSISLEAFKTIMSQSWAYVVSEVGIVIYMRIDQVMVGRMLDASELGRYSAAVALTDYFNFIPLAFGSAMLPILTEVFKKDKKAFRKEYVLYYERMILGVLAIVALIQIFGKLAIFILYGQDFADAIIPLRIYAISEIFTAVGVTHSAFINLHLAQKKNMFCTCSAAVLNVVLNLWWIPRFGTSGAAWATVVCQFTASIAGYLLWADTREMLGLVLEALRFKCVRGRLRK